jgi:hypothetical protein
MKPFAPRFEILPPAQRKLWNELSETPRGFVLYGGTALALHLGATGIPLTSISPDDMKLRLVTAARNVDLDRLPSLDNPTRKIDRGHGHEL